MADQETLKRDITGPLLFLFILGDVLGAGIYALMGVLAQDVGGALWAPLALAPLLALPTAGSYAEMVTKYPRAGGAAVFAERAFRLPLVSFLVGFSMLAAGVTSAAGLSRAFFGEYLATFVDVPAVPAAIVFLALVACLNARGISESLTSNVVMTIVEVSGLVIVIAVVAIMVFHGDGEVARLGSSRPGRPPRWRSWPARSSPITRSSASRRRRTSSRRSASRPACIRARCSARWRRPVSSTCWWASPVPLRCLRASWPSRAGRCWRWSRHLGSACPTGCSASLRSSPSPMARCSP